MSRSRFVWGWLLALTAVCLAVACQNSANGEGGTPAVVMVEVPVTVQLLATVEVPITVEVTRVEVIEVTAVPTGPLATATPEATATLDWQALKVFTATFPISVGDPPIELKCPGSTQLELNFCAARDAYQMAREVDEVMTELIPILNGLSGSDQWVQLLLESHESWELHKRQDCDWKVSIFEGGSIQPLMYWSCIAAANGGRARELRLAICVYFQSTSDCVEENS